MADAPAHAMTRRTIHGDGLPLAVWEGPRNGPTVLFVHGYPDTHVVWDRVVERLAGDFHCVVYDVRGAGESGVPADRAGYRLAHLRADLAAVLDAVAPSEQVHLVGHDWGSLQAWDAVVRADGEPALTGRFASYTTISGPCLDHVSAWTSAAWRGGWQRKREALRQLRHSWYVFAFQIPVLPELVLRRVNRRLLATRQHGTYHFADTLARGRGARRQPLPREHPGSATGSAGRPLHVPARAAAGPASGRVRDPGVLPRPASFRP